MAKKFVGTLEKDVADLDQSVRSHTIQMLSKGHNRIWTLKKGLVRPFSTMFLNLMMTQTMLTQWLRTTKSQRKDQDWAIPWLRAKRPWSFMTKSTEEVPKFYVFQNDFTLWKVSFCRALYCHLCSKYRSLIKQTYYCKGNLNWIIVENERIHFHVLLPILCSNKVQKQIESSSGQTYVEGWRDSNEQKSSYVSSQPLHR